MRLADFRDEKAICVIADLMDPVSRIIANEKNKEAHTGTKLQFAQSILRNNASDVKDMLAILNDEDPAKYTCTAATVFRDVMIMLSDPDLMSLFGLQSQTPASSGSVSGNSEAQAG